MKSANRLCSGYEIKLSHSLQVACCSAVSLRRPTLAVIIYPSITSTIIALVSATAVRLVAMPTIDASQIRHANLSTCPSAVSDELSVGFRGLSH